MLDHTTSPNLDHLLDQRTWLAGLARRLVHDAHAAEDAAQETWLQAASRRLSLQEPRAWLATVLGNVVRQRHRGDARRRRREQTVAAGAQADTPAVADANERFEVQRAVAAAVHALDEPFRSTVLLHHFEGRALADIARLQDVPAGTVRWRLHRAHELLRERLRGTYGDAHWRASLLLLCLPRRSAVALPLLAAALLLIGTVVWLAPWPGGELGAPPRTATAALDVAASTVPSATSTARGTGDEARAAVATAAPATDAPPPIDLTTSVVATVTSDDGNPLAGASLALTGMKAAAVRAGLSHLEVPAALLPNLAAPAASRGDGRVQLAMRAGRELLALLPEATPRDLVGAATFTVSAEGHAAEHVTVHLAPGDTMSLGTVALQRVGLVTGRAQFADGRPAAGATVCLHLPPFAQFPEQLAQQQFAGDGQLRTTAGDDGTFRIAGVRTGLVMAWASLPGHTSAFASVDVVAGGSAVPALVLRPATVAPPITYEKKVVVHVVDVDGKPVEGARVDYRWDGARGPLNAGMTRTRSNGRVTIDLWRGCTERPLRLAVSAQHDEPLLGPVGLDVPLHRDDEVTLVLPVAATCAVRAVDPDGAAIAAFTATWAALAPHVGEASARGAAGRATLLAPNVPATLTVAATGFLPQTQRLVPGAVDAVVTLSRHRGISGRVTAAGKPVAGARVSVLHCDQPVLHNGFRSEGERRGHFDATSDGDGRFHVDQFTAATLRLLVRAPGHANLVTAPHAFDPARGWNDLALALGDGGTLTGVVRDADGAPRPRVWVAINDFFGDARTVLSDAEGRYRCTNLRAGDYEVRTTEQGITEDNTSTIGDRELATISVHADCSVRDGETTTWDVLACRGRVTGRLQAVGFTPRGWLATLRRDHDRRPLARPTRLGDDGGFSLATAHSGPHQLLLEAPGGLFGNVTVTIRLDVQPGEQSLVVPLALAPTQGVAAGGSATAWTSLEQTRGDTTVRVPVRLDPATLAFTAVLAPVGDVVLRQGTATGSTELARHVVAPR